MDSYFIRKRDNPQVAAPQLWNCTPEPMTIVFLGLGTKRVVENANAPLSLDVWPFAQDLSLEILGEALLGHLDRLPQLSCALDVAV